MSAPTTPSESDIVTEAYSKFGIISPSSSQITRGTTWGMQQVKDKIMAKSKRWSPLSKKDFPILTANLPYLAMPSDYAADMKVSIVDGVHTGALQAASSTSLTLAASENAIQLEVQGKLIFILTGSGAAQAKYCTAYNTTTKVATLDSALTVTPAQGDTYLVESIRIPLGAPSMGWDYDRLVYPTTSMRPWKCYYEADSNHGQLMFYPTPDKAYGVIRKYYSNIQRLDVTLVPYTTLLMDWRDLFVQGVYAWVCGDQDDERKTEAWADFSNLLTLQGGKDIAGNNSSDLQITVEDDYGQW